jgi:chaperonin GroES
MCEGKQITPAPRRRSDRHPSNHREDLGGQTIVSVSIKPLEDRILVQTLEAEQTTASGLVIPDTAKEKPQEGKVLAVGPGRFDEDGDKRIPLDIKVGDVVIYSKYGGTEVKYNNEEYLILSARDVLAIVDK